jgi:hypothetical protein
MAQILISSWWLLGMCLVGFMSWRICLIWASRTGREWLSCCWVRRELLLCYMRRRSRWRVQTEGSWTSESRQGFNNRWCSNNSSKWANRWCRIQHRKRVWS